MGLFLWSVMFFGGGGLAAVFIGVASTWPAVPEALSQSLEHARTAAQPQVTAHVLGARLPR